MPRTAQLQPDTAFSPRLALSLLIAILLHAALLPLLPSLPTKTRPARNPLQVTITHNDRATAPTTDSRKNNQAETPTDSKARSKSDPVKEDNTNHPEAEASTTTAPTAMGRSEAIKEAIKEVLAQPRTTNSAQEPSTVFDPRLAEKIARERNKVKKFKSRDTEMMTVNGTFVQNGDKCYEIRELLPHDIDSNVSQRFNIKCSKRRRPEEDIERLAHKYGIP